MLRAFWGNGLCEWIELDERLHKLHRCLFYYEFVREGDIFLGGGRLLPDTKFFGARQRLDVDNDRGGNHRKSRASGRLV